MLGRVGEAVKVRGLFLHPRQAAAAFAGVPRREATASSSAASTHQDTLRCEVVPGAGGGDLAGLADTVKERIRAALRLGAEVTCVASLPDGPAIVDERDWKSTRGTPCYYLAVTSPVPSDGHR